MQETIDQINAWQLKTFPDATALSKAKHLQKEVKELIEALQTGDRKENIENEFADCFMLLFGSAYKYGLTFLELTRNWDFWQVAGDSRTAISRALFLQQIVEELVEFLPGSQISSTKDKYRQCCQLLFSTAFAFGIKTLDVEPIILKKFAENQKRVWGTPDGHGVVHHVKQRYNKGKEFSFIKEVKNGGRVADAKGNEIIVADKKYVLQKDIIIPAGTVFDNNSWQAKYGGYFETPVGIGKDCCEFFRINDMKEILQHEPTYFKEDGI